MNEVELRIESIRLFLEAIAKCPHVNISTANGGAPKLADEIVKGADKLREYIQSVPSKT